MYDIINSITFVFIYMFTQQLKKKLYEHERIYTQTDTNQTEPIRTRTKELGQE
jgi:hypothetical protein